MLRVGYGNALQVVVMHYLPGGGYGADAGCGVFKDEGEVARRAVFLDVGLESVCVERRVDGQRG